MFAPFPPVGPGGGGAAPPPCDDQGCCNAAVGAVACGALIGPCAQVPGTVTAVQPNHSATNLPHNPGFVTVCNTCVQHDQGYKETNIDMRVTPGRVGVPPGSHAGPPVGTSLGTRVELCAVCTREEMLLYWRRVGTAQPVEPPGNSLNDIWQWPTANAGPLSAQDLCKCRRTSVNPWIADRCHACRDALYDGIRTQPAIENDRFLRTRTLDVLKGNVQCTLNGGAHAHIEPIATRNRRLARGIGRRCPCGTVPRKRPEPNATHFIDVCLACMGVRVFPQNIPADHSRDALIPDRPTRGRPAAAAPWTTTKGKRHAQRHPNFRVNIECGWKTNPVAPHAGDPFIGGQ